jgi:hypothetical protein
MILRDIGMRLNAQKSKRTTDLRHFLLEFLPPRCIDIRLKLPDDRLFAPDQRRDANGFRR